MNLLTFRLPTRIGWSDSCPFGLGGYTLGGFGWRIRIPEDSLIYGDDSVNNPLEFLGMAVTIKLLLMEAAGEDFPCLLPLGDNTSAIGWIFRSGRIKKSSRYFSAVKLIAREIARDVTNADAQVTPQHLRGNFNDVSDLLSFAGKARGKTNPLTVDNPSDALLTHRLHNSPYSQLIPKDFRIYKLPDEIASFVCLVLGTLEESWTPSKKSPSARGKGHGGDGDPSWGRSEPLTRTSVEYPEGDETCSAGASLSSFENQVTTSRGELLADVRNRWWSRLCATPSAIWQRRFGQVTGGAPSTERKGPSVAAPFEST
jgi:hypothetical protein